MALTVFLIDNRTRIVMPDSEWGLAVVAKLKELGHNVTETKDDPSEVEKVRTTTEMYEVGVLLEETGL